MNKNTNIVLIGFMGSGKTTVSRIVGEKLNKEVIEMDDLILKLSKRKTISEIFEKDSEIRFRELEIQVAKLVASKKNVVISTGGGVVMNKIIIDYFSENGKIVYLETSFDTVEKRLKNEKDKPLFKNVLKARKLFEFRKPLYDYFSEYMVNTNEKTPEEVADEILVKLNEEK